MLSKKLLITVFVTSLICLFYQGCAPEQADLSLRFTPDESQTYWSVTHLRKDYLFDQPTAGKKTEKVTETIVDMTYDQSVLSVDEQGKATAKVTIKSIKYSSRNADGTNIDYDTAGEQGGHLAGLVGKTYTIKLSPNGNVVEVIDAKAARSTVKQGRDARIAKSILSDDGIKWRHQILALPDKDKSLLRSGDSWSQVASSPKGTLVPKNYEKMYVVKSIVDSPSGKIATIEMSATPTTKTSGETSNSSGGLGLFGNMFESSDDFTGKLVINLTTGRVLKYYETLKSEHTAAEFPQGKEAAEAAEPDLLKLAFTKSQSIEMVN